MAARIFRSGKLIAHSCAILLAAVLATQPVHSEQGPGHRPELSLPTLAPLIKRISPAVVAVAGTRQVPADQGLVGPGVGFPDAPLPRVEEVSGSGVIVDAGIGLVITANHVIENAETIAVTLSDGRRVGAIVLAASEDDDLAVLRIAAGGLTGVSLGDASALEVGDFVLAIGSPLGLGQSATFGIVSALHRSSPGIKNAELIQIDASIDQGSSGGALINIRGELVGINVARVGRANGSGFGFAVPADAIRSLLASIRLG